MAIRTCKATGDPNTSLEGAISAGRAKKHPPSLEALGIMAGENAEGKKVFTFQGRYMDSASGRVVCKKATFHDEKAAVVAADHSAV